MINKTKILIGDYEQKRKQVISFMDVSEVVTSKILIKENFLQTYQVDIIKIKTEINWL